MSLETALNRARYRHLDRLHEVAIRHWNRSHLIGYWRRAEQIASEMTALYHSCSFR